MELLCTNTKRTDKPDQLLFLAMLIFYKKLTVIVHNYCEKLKKNLWLHLKEIEIELSAMTTLHLSTSFRAITRLFKINYIGEVAEPVDCLLRTRNYVFCCK